MIRLILILLFLLIFFLIFSIPAYLVLWITGKFSMELRSRMAQAVVRNAFKFILFLSGTKLTVIGKEKIPSDTAVTYVGNHNSFFDIVIGYSLVPNITGFIAKKEIRKVPFLNWWMIFVNCLFLDRENIKEGLKTILQGIELLKSGISVFVFPEGTRSKDGTMGTFKEGTMKLAEKSKCPIVPVTFTHTADILENHFPFVKAAKVTVEFGDPIDVTALSRDEVKRLSAYTQKIIQAAYDKNY